jgi:hypothetical protein
MWSLDHRRSPLRILNQPLLSIDNRNLLREKERINDRKHWLQSYRWSSLEQALTHRPASYVDKKAISGGSATGGFHFQNTALCKGNHWKILYPWLLVELSSWSSKQWWAHSQGPLTIVRIEEPWVIITVKQCKISFPLPPAPGPQIKSLFEAYWFTPRALFHSAPGSLLGRSPLMSFLLNNSWDSHFSLGARSYPSVKNSAPFPSRGTFFVGH